MGKDKADQAGGTTEASVSTDELRSLISKASPEVLASLGGVIASCPAELSPTCPQCALQGARRGMSDRQKGLLHPNTSDHT